MSLFDRRPPWYIAGLAFECAQCGRCCAGPEEGFVWVTDEEITEIAAFLKITPQELRRSYLRRDHGRYTIAEQPRTKDCAFLQNDPSDVSAAAKTVCDLASPHICHTGEAAPTSGRKCRIYSVRPVQCRTWPFWPGNLGNIDSWHRAAARCKGINRGKLYSFDEIQRRAQSADRS